MNAKTAKLVRRLNAKLGHSPALAAALKRMWYATPWDRRHALRSHMKRAIQAKPEDVMKVFGEIAK
jgi:hypothetical protein